MPDKTVFTRIAIIIPDIDQEVLPARSWIRDSIAVDAFFGIMTSRNGSGEWGVVTDAAGEGLSVRRVS